MDTPMATTATTTIINTHSVAPWLLGPNAMGVGSR